MFKIFVTNILQPEEMEYPMLYSEMALYFMVNLIYSCIAPVMSYFMLMTFTVLSLVYRHQLIYIYTSKSDKGGKLWPCMINLLLVSIIISEVTLIGIMSIKKGAVAAALMIPLVIATILFVFYIKQEHFRVTEFVPSTICKEEDIKNHGSLDISFLHGCYLQPSLQVKFEYPETDLTVFEMYDANPMNKTDFGDKDLDITEAECILPEGPEEDDNDSLHLTRHVTSEASMKSSEFPDTTSEIPYEERTKLVDNVEQLHEHEKVAYEKLESDAFYSCKEQETKDLDTLDDTRHQDMRSLYEKSGESQHFNENASCESALEKEA
jgi:Uncharacterized integral membrane protein